MGSAKCGVQISTVWSAQAWKVEERAQEVYRGLMKMGGRYLIDEAGDIEAEEEGVDSGREASGAEDPILVSRDPVRDDGGNSWEDVAEGESVFDVVFDVVVVVGVVVVVEALRLAACRADLSMRFILGRRPWARRLCLLTFCGRCEASQSRRAQGKRDVEFD